MSLWEAIMASLLPIIDDILPMILPSSVSVTKKTDIIPLIPPMVPNADGTSGSHRVRVYSRDAVVGKLDKICSSGMPFMFSLVFSLPEGSTVVISEKRSAGSVTKFLLNNPALRRTRRHHLRRTWQRCSSHSIIIQGRRRRPGTA